VNQSVNQIPRWPASQGRAPLERRSTTPRTPGEGLDDSISQATGLLPRWSAGLLLACALTMPALNAQTLPPTVDPEALRGLLERDRERLEEERRLERERPDAIDEPPSPEVPARADPGPEFALRGVSFSASDFLSTEELATLAEPYVGQQVRFAELDQLVADVNAVYQRRGLFTARAVLPPQRIVDGVVSILLVEGRLGSLDIAGNAYTRDEFIRRRLPVVAGEVLDGPVLRDALDRFNADSELGLRASLRPGAEFGETDVLIQVAEPPRHAWAVFLDNAGVESTGEYRLGGQWSVSGLRGASDQLAAHLLLSEGAVSTRVDYATMLAATGGILQAGGYANWIRIVDGPFEALGIRGDSYGTELAYSHPLAWRPAWDVHGLSRLAYVSSTSEIDGEDIADNTVQRLSLGLRGRFRGGSYAGSVNQRVIRVESSNILDESEGHTYYAGGLFWSQRPRNLPIILLASGGWQFTSEEFLPSSDLFQIGGPGSVRGYPQGVLAGVKGYYLNVETQWRRLGVLTPYVFLDHGRVLGQGPEQEGITGFGVGASYQWPQGVRAEASVGHALDEVVPDLDRVRLDLRLVYRFPGR